MITRGYGTLVITVLLMTSLIHVQTENIRRYYMISIGKPVLVEPTGVTCTEGNITLDRTKMSRGYNGSDITYQCLSTCKRRYPLDHSTLLQAVGEDEVVHLGGSDCHSNDTRRKRHAQDGDVTMECSRQVDTRPVSPTYTFALEVYPESEGVYFEMVGMFRLRFAMLNSSFPKTVFESEDGENIESVHTRPNAWNSVALQFNYSNLERYPRDIWITVFVNGSSRPAYRVLRLGYPMPINGTNNPIFLGHATIQPSDLVFHGKMRNVKIYQEMLTDREIYALHHGKLSVISPNSECLCPQEFPIVKTGWDDDMPDLEVYCKTRSSLAGYVPRLVDSDTGRLFSTDYLTDGETENSEDYDYSEVEFIPSGFRMWASTPGISTFHLTIDLQEYSIVTVVSLQGMVMPAEGIYKLEQYGQNSWQEIQRFVSGNLPCVIDNGCTVMLSPYILIWTVPRVKLYEFKSTVTTNKLRLHLNGNLTSNQDFYLLTEFAVAGRRACECYDTERHKQYCRPEWRCGEADQTTPSTSSSPGGVMVHLLITLALGILAASTSAVMIT